MAHVFGVFRSATSIDSTRVARRQLRVTGVPERGLCWRAMLRQWLWRLAGAHRSLL